MVTIDTYRDTSRSHGGFAGFARRCTLAIVRSLSWLSERLEIRRSRLALLELTEAQLKDIGLSRADAEGEGARPWWR